jgi:hypothetical protein
MRSNRILTKLRPSNIFRSHHINISKPEIPNPETKTVAPCVSIEEKKIAATLEAANIAARTSIEAANIGAKSRKTASYIRASAALVGGGVALYGSVKYMAYKDREKHIKDLERQIELLKIVGAGNVEMLEIFERKFLKDDDRSKYIEEWTKKQKEITISTYQAKEEHKSEDSRQKQKQSGGDRAFEKITRGFK